MFSIFLPIKNLYTDEGGLNELKKRIKDTDIKTRMKTSISSKAFCTITDRQTYKIFTE